MEKNINRRAFIKGSALAGMAGMVTTNPVAGALSSELRLESEETPGTNLSFNKDGKFKIMQLTDTHYIAGNPKSKRALDNVNQMLDLEKPDLVIHTGDIIFGEPAEQSLREILGPISERKIPFAAALGNHDEEYDKTREEVAEIINSIPYNINNNVKGIYGATNCYITLSSSNSDKVQRVLYILDSNRGSTIEGIGGYGFIHFDQIAWYRKQSEYFTKMNGGVPVPSLAFFHIPLPEHKEASQDDKNGRMIGTRRENVASPIVNSGMFVSMKEMQDIQAVFTGHDHNSDFAVYWNEMFFIYGRFSGCDTVYNDLKPNGARVIELTENEKEFRSWVRLYGGEIIQNLQYPNDF
ncbi:MAG TPA: metallophosphoesterase family protein [Daejeonella sp.]|nr:metallophosphoesterase family protein [Daejeonella sp.]